MCYLGYFVFTDESRTAACSSKSDEWSDTINQWKEVTISLYQLGDGSFQMQAQLHQRKKKKPQKEKESPSQACGPPRSLEEAYDPRLHCLFCRTPAIPIGYKKG